MRVAGIGRLWRGWTRGALGAALLALAMAFTAAPARADHHHHGGTHVTLGFGFFAGPPYYYPPAYYYPYYYPYYYYPPPVYYAPPPAVVVQSSPSCTSGDWRQDDGSIVHGVACRQPDGSWRLTN